MRQFSLFRYLKQFSLLIFLLAALGSMAVFFYGQSQQRYIASTVIQYTNNGAKEGYTPDGSPLNVEEIYSPTVIDAALTDLGYPTNIDVIRSNCYVEEVIPENQKKLNEALLEKGEQPAYVSDTYRVYYVGNNDTGEQFARNVLDAIINNYYEFYAGKYVEEQLQNNGVSVLAEGNYDCLESAQVLEDSVLEMLNYLLNKRESHPYFRSVDTGYTYSDLYRIYNFLYNYEIPSLYASILTNAETSDIDLLMDRLTRDCEDLQLYIDNRQTRAESLRTLIDNYSKRNKEMMDYHYHSSASQGIGTEYILKDVEYSKENGNKETTYDGLIQEYVNLNISIRQKAIEKEHKEYLLSIFDAAVHAKERKTLNPEEIRGKIAHCANLATKYYKYVEETGHELNRYLSANYLKAVSSINVQSAVNIKLYLVIAIVLFAVVGGVVAVLLGRTLDFIDYFRYVDSTVQLPNRAKCDVFINECSEKLLSADFSCLVLRMDSLGSLSSTYGREVGDGVLKNFAMILKSFGDSYGFVGYNGSGVFLAFFPDCSSQKTDVILEAIRRQVLKYNNANPEQKICYTYGKAVSSEDNVFEIRQLLRLAMQRMNSGHHSPVSKDTPAENGEADQRNLAQAGQPVTEKPETEKPEPGEPKPEKPETAKAEAEESGTEQPGPEEPKAEQPEAEGTKPEVQEPGQAENEKSELKESEAEESAAGQPEAEEPKSEGQETGQAEAGQTEPKESETEESAAGQPETEEPKSEGQETGQAENGQPESKQSEGEESAAGQPDAEEPKSEGQETGQAENGQPESKESETEESAAEQPDAEETKSEGQEAGQPENGQPESKQSEAEESAAEQLEAEEPKPEGQETGQAEADQTEPKESAAEQPKAEEPKPEGTEAEESGAPKTETEEQKEEKLEAEGPEPEKSETETPATEKPETEASDSQKEEAEKPETEQPESAKPENEKPEPEKSEKEDAEIRKPETEMTEQDRDK